MPLDKLIPARIFERLDAMSYFRFVREGRSTADARSHRHEFYFPLFSETRFGRYARIGSGLV
jgi:hypothetical protein